MTQYKVMEVTFFDKTRTVKAECHNMTAEDTPDKILWVERGEDYYALMSPGFKDKKVAIVTREEWLRYD